MDCGNRICQLFGYNEDTIRSRGGPLWLWLSVAFPCAWTSAFLTAYVFGAATGWAWFYIPSIVVQFIMCAVVPYTLYFSLDHMKTKHHLRFHIAAMIISAHYVTMLLPFVGLFYHPWIHVVPFQSGTWLILSTFVSAPLLMLAYHAAVPIVLNTDAGDSVLGILLFHSTNVTRLMDPLADMVLGAKLVTHARTGPPHCPFQGSQDCSSHVAVGVFILASSVLDYIFSTVNIMAIHLVLPKVPLRRRVMMMELMMFAAELGVLVGMVVLQMYGMAGDTGLESHPDMRSYAILCGISTFGCLLTTLLSLLLPPDLQRVAEEHGVRAAAQHAWRASPMLQWRRRAPVGSGAPAGGGSASGEAAGDGKGTSGHTHGDDVVSSMPHGAAVSITE